MSITHSQSCLNERTVDCRITPAILEKDSHRDQHKHQGPLLFTDRELYYMNRL